MYILGAALGVKWQVHSIHICHPSLFDCIKYKLQ